MGRPISKKKIGAPGSTPVILFSDAFISTASSQSAPNSVYILKQISTIRFQVSDGVNTGEVTLQAGPITGPGQGRIDVTPFGGGPIEYASKINDRTVVTFEDHRYSYDLHATSVNHS